MKGEIQFWGHTHRQTHFNICPSRAASSQLKTMHKSYISSNQAWPHGTGFFAGHHVQGTTNAGMAWSLKFLSQNFIIQH